MNPHARFLHNICADARAHAGTVVTITVWRCDDIARELTRLEDRIAELEALAVEPTLFGGAA